MLFDKEKLKLSEQNAGKSSSTVILQGMLKSASQLLGRLGHNKAVKNTARETAGIAQLLKLLQKPSTAPGLAEAIVQALTVLVVDNELNQDHVRQATWSFSIISLTLALFLLSYLCTAGLYTEEALSLAQGRTRH